MSFVFSEILHVVNTLDDLLSMSEPQALINISTGYTMLDNNDESDEEENDEIFLKIVFSLKHGKVEMRLYENFGNIGYIDSDGSILKTIEFDDENIAEINGSFKKALKQIREFDRQHGSIPKIANIPIDRASFGLAEAVN